MTQEEKAKAYDEALEKAKEYYKDCKQRGNLWFVEDMEDMFPELAESEDDKIRKFLIQMAQNGHGRDKDWWNKCVAWLEKQGEQKPAEWSEDDIIRIDTLSTFVKLYGTGYYQKFEIEGVVDWIKSLKDRVQPQPKQEWNEEDSRLINEVIELIDAGSLDRKEKDDYIERLKSLRPKSQWKPSEEQLYTLEKATHIVGSKYKSCLNSLYSDLKKLREE